MIISHQFRTLNEFFSAACRQVFDVFIKTPSKNISSVVKTALYVSTGLVWEEIKFSKKKFLVCFHHFRILGELFRAFCQTFRQGCRNCILNVQRNNLKINICFDEINFLKRFRTLSRRNRFSCKSFPAG